MKFNISSLLACLAAFSFGTATTNAETLYQSEVVIPETLTAEEGSYSSPLPHTYITEDELPDRFSWGNVNGTSYLTKVQNQHVPHYCGSCWAFATLSSLGDRIKIARGPKARDEINLSVQAVLNCGSSAGSCNGGWMGETWKFIQQSGGVPYDTCQAYTACSTDSNEGFCNHIDTSCSAINTCRTCGSFSKTPPFKKCQELDRYPNATISEWGYIPRHDGKDHVSMVHAMKAEIYARGPVAVGINAHILNEYNASTIISDINAPKRLNHFVSIVGWGKDDATNTQYWITRNSWGHTWGDMGYFKVKLGENILGIEDWVTWATPSVYTVHNYPCPEDGYDHCLGKHTDGPSVTKVLDGGSAQMYVDPSQDVAALKRRLSHDNAAGDFVRSDDVAKLRGSR